MRVSKAIGAGKNPNPGTRKTNPGGATRSPEEAIEIAQRAGIDVSDFEIQIIPVKSLEGGATAQYAQFGPSATDRWIRWEEIATIKGPGNTRVVPVLVPEWVLQSDEAIVAVLAHETHEINTLRGIFAKQGGMKQSQFKEAVEGWLHDEAWIESEKAWERWRKIE